MLENSTVRYDVRSWEWDKWEDDDDNSNVCGYYDEDEEEEE